VKNESAILSSSSLPTAYCLLSKALPWETGALFYRRFPGKHSNQKRVERPEIQTSEESVSDRQSAFGNSFLRLIADR
jgi:hypothetical protein